MRTVFSVVLVMIVLLLSCGNGEQAGQWSDTRIYPCEMRDELAGYSPEDTVPSHKNIRGALLATRFASLEALQQEVRMTYDQKPNWPDSVKMQKGEVSVEHCSDGKKVVSILKYGIHEGDFKKVQSGGWKDKVALMFKSPFAITNRMDLQRVYILARRRQDLFGEGDPAFYDIAEHIIANIHDRNWAFRFENDKSEKGYLNTFNHITAQAFITTLFSEPMADFVADVHERYHMPELISGVFTPEQLVDPITNPVDNYVDIVNNEWGQELGKAIKSALKITRESHWSPELLAEYLNRMQSYYAWSMELSFYPFSPSDDVIIRFADKINFVMFRMQDGDVEVKE